MFRIFLALGLISLSGCASASNFNVSDSESITISNTDIVNLKTTAKALFAQHF